MGCDVQILGKQVLQPVKHNSTVTVVQLKENMNILFKEIESQVVRKKVIIANKLFEISQNQQSDFLRLLSTGVFISNYLFIFYYLTISILFSVDQFSSIFENIVQVHGIYCWVRTFTAGVWTVTV